MIREAKMTKGMNFKNRKEYVERDLHNAFIHVDRFNGIRYAHTNDNTDQEYIRVESIIGTVAYLDVTAMPKAQILQELACLLCFGKVPPATIEDEVKIRQVAMLFI